MRGAAGRERRELESEVRELPPEDAAGVRTAVLDDDEALFQLLTETFRLAAEWDDGGDDRSDDEGQRAAPA
jgi:hypothetical protein